MTSHEEKHSSNQVADEDVSLGAPCADDSFPNPSIPDSWKTNPDIGFPTMQELDASLEPTDLSGGALPESSDSARNDLMQAQAALVWLILPVDTRPTVDAEQFMQRAKELPTRAGELVAEAWSLKNAHDAQDVAAQLMQRAKELEAEALTLRNVYATGAIGNGSATSTRTTANLKNIPLNVTREEFCTCLNENGFKGCYDFVYLPMDFKRNCGQGFAFVNLTSPYYANLFFAFFTGFQGWGKASEKVCQVVWAQVDGLEANIIRYRKCPVMHKSVPDEHKPIVLRDGERIPFPSPEKGQRVRRPRESHGTSRSNKRW